MDSPTAAERAAGKHLGQFLGLLAAVIGIVGAIILYVRHGKVDWAPLTLGLVGVALYGHQRRDARSSATTDAAGGVGHQ